MQRRAAAALTAVSATAGGLALLLNFETRSPDTATSAAGATTASASSAGSRTADGQVESNRWGNVQVEVTVENGRITNVTMLEVPGSHGRSVEINDRAVPILQQETLTAQSAHIDMVSGATDTSQGYIASLQAALDQLGIT
jgi:uncharacterized protein with FMN-binding domain